MIKSVEFKKMTTNDLDNDRPGLFLTDAAREREQLMAKPLYNGELIYNVNIDELPDKPWRSRDCTPAKLSQYFNYGFDEATWRLYCKLRKEEEEKQSK